jgi:L-malate glycosyltransferase
VADAPAGQLDAARRIRQRGLTVSHFVGHLAHGDAVSYDAVNKWQALRALGVRGDLFCAEPGEHYRSVARRPSEHRPAPDELIVFHYSVWSDTAEYVLRRTDAPVLFVYHNVTPPHWFAGVHEHAERSTRLGRERLGAFADRAPLAAAMSEYSRRELEQAGYRATDVVPVMVEFDRIAKRASRAARRAESGDGYTNVLSVGRIAPHKCFQDTIALFYHYKRNVNPRSRLFVVGLPVVGAYNLWLTWLIGRLGLEPHVQLVGHVSDEDLAAYYAQADAYVTMSEHEGFCAPVLEAMAAGVPVLAFDSTAIPDTVGDAGVLMRRKDPAFGGEILHQIVSDTPLRRRLIAKGRERVHEFAPERTRDRFLSAVARAVGC